MAEVITMLALSPTMEEGTIAEWFKQEGETVEDGEVIAEVETDKAAMEMESFHDGVVLKVLVSKGDTVKVGDPMAVVGEEGEDPDEALAEFGGGGDADTGDDDEAAAVAESSAEDDEEDEEEAADRQDAEAAQEASSAQTSADEQRKGKRIKASPLARRMAEEHSIALADVDGSGPNGRIVKKDIEAAVEAAGEEAEAAEQAPEARAPEAPAAPSGEPTRIAELPDADGSREGMSQMRKTIARRMTQVWQNTPFFYLTMDIDMGAAMAKRKEFNAELKQAEVDAKISVNDMIVKACALALRQYPRMNVAFDNDALVTFDEVHIGVAVALEEGLITPTLRNADIKSLTSISRETRELAGKARDRKLKPHEYGSSTFSISNLGMYGIDHFQAVINPPEAGILACGAVQKVPVVNDDGDLDVGTRMKVTLTCDHRAVDGAIGAEFLGHVRKMLENPTLLLI